MIKKLFWEYIKQNKIKSILCILALVVSILLSLTPAQLIRIITDDYLDRNNMAVLVILICAYVLSYVLYGLSNFLKNYLLLSFSQYYFAYVRKAMINHYSKIDYRLLTDVDIGTYEGYFGNDLNSLNSLFEDGIIDMISDLFKMVGILISLYMYSYIFGLIVTAILPLIIFMTLFFQRRMLKAQKEVKSCDGNANEILFESIENIEQIKINKAYKYSKNRYETILNTNYKESQKSYFYDAIFSPIMQMIRCILIATIILVSGLKSDIFNMTVGMIISSLSLISDLFSPIENIGMEIQTIQQSIASYQRLNKFFEYSEVLNNNDEIKGYSIEIKSCSFKYEDKDVLSNFNLDIKEKDKILLKGESGKGKSTLMKLVLGLLKPNEGDVTIGGKPSFLLNEEERNRLFSIVYQDPFFNGGTIYEEMTLLNDSISKESVFDALNKVGLSKIKDIDIKLNPNEYSSGELQLFNIARILLKDSSIICLDEMNSKIDSITNKQIISLINNLFKDKTIISINHFGESINNVKIVEL